MGEKCSTQRAQRGKGAKGWIEYLLYYAIPACFHYSLLSTRHFNRLTNNLEANDPSLHTYRQSSLTKQIRKSGKIRSLSRKISDWELMICKGDVYDTCLLC